MAHVLEDMIYTDKKGCVVFASTQPITRSSSELEMKDIVMSFLWLTSSDSPTVMHLGIFRNPSDFLDVKEKYRGIALPLHSFAAKVALKQFSGKKYMVTHPMRSMTAIFSRCLGPDMHLGDNLDLKNFDDHSSENQALLKQHPPILHHGLGVHEIAKEGVDLSEHLDFLPDEKAEVILPPGETFAHYSPMTMGCLFACVNLTKLSHLNSQEKLA